MRAENYPAFGAEMMSEEKNTIMRYKPQTTEELKRLAKALVHNEVFLSTDPKEIQTAWRMVIALLDPQQFELWIEDDIVAWYEYYQDTDTKKPTYAQGTINRLPMFMSARMLNRDDYTKMISYYRRLKDAEQQALED